MMIVEGFGRKAPAPAVVMLTSGDMQTFIAEARRRSEFRDYANKNGQWENGLIQGDAVIHNVGVIRQADRPIICGSIGEHVVATYLNSRIGRRYFSVDFGLKKNGDGGIDLKSTNARIQVKTRQRESGINLIRAANDRGYRLKLDCDFYAFCEWLGGDSARFLGWAPTRQLLDLPLVAARVGSHKNIEIPDIDLLPPQGLANEVIARMEPR